MRSLLACISIGIVLFAATCSFAGNWTAYDGVHVAQNSAQWKEVLPAEDMDSAHPSPSNIDWGSKAANYIRFYPSLSMNYPVPGDTVCWLYNRTDTVTWWQGTFNKPTPKIVVQMAGCDSGDGWVDIYVDGVLEFSWDTRDKGSVQIVGTNLSYAPHQVKLQTRAAPVNTANLSIDYVAASAAIPTLNQWGLIILLLLLAAAATAVIHRRRRVTA